MIAFSHSLMHILTFFFFLEFCFAGVAEILHSFHLFPNPSMARTRGVHSFRPRVRPSSPPLVAGQSTPPAAATAASHAPVPVASAPRKYDTWVGPTPPSPAHPRPSHRARTSGSGESSSSRPQEPHSPPVHGQADDIPWICLLLLLFGVPSSIAVPLQPIQIAVPRKCTVRHSMIF